MFAVTKIQKGRKLCSYISLKEFIHRWKKNLLRSEKEKKRSIPCFFATGGKCIESTPGISVIKQPPAEGSDPYTNAEVMELLKQETKAEELSQEMMKSYYKLPVMCLLRIKDSIDTWEKRSGADGYFDFIESYMGSQIKGTEMNFALMSPGL